MTQPHVRGVRASGRHALSLRGAAIHEDPLAHTWPSLLERSNALL